MTSQKLFWDTKKENLYIPDEKNTSCALGIRGESCNGKNGVFPMVVHNENHAPKKIMAYYLFFFRRFWVKELRHSQTIFAKKRYTIFF